MNDDGTPKSVNSVYEQFRGSPMAVSRNTLRLAFQGLLDRGKFENLQKLAAIASALSGKQVGVEDLLGGDRNG